MHGWPLTLTLTGTIAFAAGLIGYLAGLRRGCRRHGIQRPTLGAGAHGRSPDPRRRRAGQDPLFLFGPGGDYRRAVYPEDLN